MFTLYCPRCESRGRKPAILAKVGIKNGELELWCRKCREPISVIIADGKIEYRRNDRRTSEYEDLI